MNRWMLVPVITLIGLSLLVLVRFLRLRQRCRKIAESQLPGYAESIRQARTDLRKMRSAFACILRKRPRSEVYQRVVTDANAARLEEAFTYMAQDIRRAQQRVFPPGWFLIDLAALFCSLQTIERVVVPSISDMQSEHSSALGEKRGAAAAWIRIRGCASFWKTLALHSLDQLLGSIWKN